MRLWRSKRSKIQSANTNNRIKVIIAIIFLFGFSILIKLYKLQAIDHDYYSAKATSQHEVFNILEPERGRIFIQDSVKGESEKIYPVATNKNFAVVYAIPKEIKEAEKIADKLYEIFKKDEVEKEADELIKKEDETRLAREIAFVSSLDLPTEEKKIKEDETRKNHEILINDEKYAELKKLKREEEISKRKEKIIGDYFKILNKGNDPYEPIEQKVEEETLKKLYALLNEDNVKEDSLTINGDKIGYKDGQGEFREIQIEGLSFFIRERRFYPENKIGSHIIGFVGQADGEERGQYGLEGFFNEELFGVRGSLKTERGAGGDLVIINNREYKKAVNGSDLILSINKNIQFTACSKLNEAAIKFGADGGTVIVLEPKTGMILAMCSWPDYDPNNYEDVSNINIYNNPAIFDQYEPGSVFKSITMAAALDQGKVAPETTYNDEGQVLIKGWPKPIKNSDFEVSGGHGVTNMNIVLEKSLNCGAIFAMRQIGASVFSQYTQNFGFGEKTGIEMETESEGNISNLLGDDIEEIYAATASFGQGITATPLQMVSAYAAIANGGVLMKPYLVKEIVHNDGFKDVTQPTTVRRVISERAAFLLSGMLVNAVENGHAKRAQVKGYYVAGKTGTAQVAAKDKRGYSEKTIHTFIGYAPIEDPKFVMLVKLDDPKGIRFAESSAVPLFGEIAEFLLNYLEVPKERE